MKTDPRPMLYEKIRKYLEQTIKLVCDVYRKKDNIYYEFHIFEDLENVVMFMDGNRKIIEEVARRVCKNFKHDFGMDINIQGTHFKLDRSYDSQVRMGVYLAKTKAELIKLDEETGAEEKLFQSYEEGSKGESYRVIVVGGKAVASMRLKSENDFRSNAHNGGIAEKAILSKEYLSLAEKAAEGLKLDYCGVDLFCDQPSIIEVNGNAYFENAERVSGINIAGVYAEYILEKIRR